jgi:hypothetical protein
MNQQLLNILIPYLSIDDLDILNAKYDHYCMLLYNDFNIVLDPREIYREIMSNSIPISKHKLELFKTQYKGIIPERIFAFNNDMNDKIEITFLSNNKFYDNNRDYKIKEISYNTLRISFIIQLRYRVRPDYKFNIWNPQEIEQLGGIKLFSVFNRTNCDFTNNKNKIVHRNYNYNHIYQFKDLHYYYIDSSNNNVNIIKKDTIEEIFEELTIEQRISLLKS